MDAMGKKIGLDEFRISREKIIMSQRVEEKAGVYNEEYIIVVNGKEMMMGGDRHLLKDLRDAHWPGAENARQFFTRVADHEGFFQKDVSVLPLVL